MMEHEPQGSRQCRADESTHCIMPTRALLLLRIAAALGRRLSQLITHHDSMGVLLSHIVGLPCLRENQLCARDQWGQR